VIGEAFFRKRSDATWDDDDDDNNNNNKSVAKLI
jgi:hypothetical protein